MITRADFVKQLFWGQKLQPISEKATAFAPSNIALCKYWGKRDAELNLPITDSLSVSLGHWGAETTVQQSSVAQDIYWLNGEQVEETTEFYRRLHVFLDLLRPHPKFYFQIQSISNLPIAAGLASSAAGFAALCQALAKWFALDFSAQKLSLLARVGSGSACRSLWSGFVHWHAGSLPDGSDSFATPIALQWPQLRLGLLILSHHAKPISSRVAMQQTVQTSTLYASWPVKVRDDLSAILSALPEHDFPKMASHAESNALAMHATMHAAMPAIMYALPETVAAMHTVWALRKQGVPVYFTQDAGPNLKLLFEEHATKAVQAAFPELTAIVAPFAA